MTKIAFSTLACPGWDWATVIARGVAYGFDGVEVRQIGGETDLRRVPVFASAQRAARRAELADAGFAVCGLGSSVRFDYPERRQREEQVDIGAEYVELAAELGARFVRVFGDVLPAGPGAERSAAVSQIAEGLNRLGEIAARSKIDILLETHGDFARSACVEELFRQVDSPAVGVLWDTHHPWRFFGEPLEETFSLLRPWVRHTHWKDSVTRPGGARADAAAGRAAQAAHALMSGHRHADYVLFGGGEFPINACAGLLQAAGYDGWLSLEWEKMWHPEIEDAQIALPLFARKMRAAWSRAGELRRS
jgi:sugar phosphate isomerase/epimerase